jgi:D-inositol-3-phosphate glycosyltransferase
VRILFVLQYYHPYVGGHESLFKNLAEGLVRRGHTVKVVTTCLRQTPRHEILNGVEIERVRVPHFADRYFFLLAGIPAAIHSARDHDLVHTSPYFGALPAYIAARRAGCPLIFTALEVLGRRWHQVENNYVKALAYRSFEKITIRLPYDRFAAISQATLEDCVVHGMNRARGRVIHLGVDEDFDPGPRTGSLRARFHIPAAAFLYLYFGRPGITKGVEDLLQAAPEIQKTIPDSQLVLILAQEPRAQYLERTRLAEKLSNKANIHILPSLPRAELIEALREADCVVVPSRTEGFGLTAAEACAMSIPVVSTRSGSLPEVVSGKHAWVEAGSPASIAEGVIRISRRDWDEIPVKRFTWEGMIEAYESLYREVLS